MKSLCKAVFIVLALVLVLGSARAGDFADTLNRGPKVGEKIPSLLEAPDQEGTTRHFETLAGRRGIILHFYRAMVLCPTCEIEAGRWSARAADFRALGYEIAAVSNDPVEILSQVARRRNIQFPLLSDPDSDIIRAFGLIDERYGADSAWYGMALPMIFVIDENCVITHRFSNADFRKRPDVDAVLTRLRKGAEG